MPVDVDFAEYLTYSSSSDDENSTVAKKRKTEISVNEGHDGSLAKSTIVKKEPKDVFPMPYQPPAPDEYRWSDDGDPDTDSDGSSIQDEVEDDLSFHARVKASKERGWEGQQTMTVDPFIQWEEQNWWLLKVMKKVRPRSQTVLRKR